MRIGIEMSPESGGMSCGNAADQSAQIAIASAPGQKPPYQAAMRTAGKALKYGSVDPRYGISAIRSSMPAQAATTATSHGFKRVDTGG